MLKKTGVRRVSVAWQKPKIKRNILWKKICKNRVAEKQMHFYSWEEVEEVRKVKKKNYALFNQLCIKKTNKLTKKKLYKLSEERLNVLF